jgi:hypothetical protein
VHGFSLHANTQIPAHRRDQHERLAVGHPKTLRDTSLEPKIRTFLTRGMTDAATST